MESEFVRWLRARLPPSPWLRVGPGDDAAVLRLGEATETVLTTDLLTDRVHFRIDRDEPRRIGRKALAVNLSDVAAMAARPVAGVISVALPRASAAELAVELFEGLLPLAAQHELAIAGGDTNTWDGPLVISVTLIGQVTEHGPLLRSGAQAGDQLIVSGEFGGSILGHHLDFEPRVSEALTLAERYELHAGIDCSDGLSLDVSRIAEESGCGAVVDVEAVPISAAARRRADAGSSGKTVLEHALTDGEDFELILAVPPGDAARMLAEQPLDVPLTRIGEFREDLGLWQFVDGRRERLQPGGFLHGAEPQ